MAEAARPVTHGRVLKIAIPIVISNATVPILGAVDTGVIGQLGAAALEEPLHGARVAGRDVEVRARRQLGEARVQAWRHGLRDRPPPMPANHPLDVSSDRNYADLESTPRTESLEDTMQRALPLWRERIEPDLRSGKTVLVVAHGNSLRGLVKHVDVCVEINQ
mgnify:CR=1 FL=1